MKRESRPILARDTEPRLDAIIRRLAGMPRSAESPYHLPNPPRRECVGQVDMFAELDQSETPG